jgi:hypothetical protein
MVGLRPLSEVQPDGGASRVRRTGSVGSWLGSVWNKKGARVVLEVVFAH